MKVVRLKAPASVGNLRLLDEDSPQPNAGEIRVRLRAASLNPHDDFVVRGIIPTTDGRVPLTDGAGEVVACGDGVTEFRVGDAVV
ncbi:MAG TPA: alcohol dehydrogenase catalytic domain-containing protein, partial [Steroidobacteraceae bacterium]|nr:alcohol dehydrogenase catalytic domain-containing protein [Steroidobacteraceae bacterium]